VTTFSIGRLGVALADGGDGFTLEHPFSWQQQGRQVTLQGRQEAASQAAAVFLVNQFNGLHPDNNPDETAIPVYSSTVTELNGWFTVVASGATITPGAFGSGGTMFIDWQVTLVRALSWYRPGIEVPTVYSGLPNGLAVTSCDLIEAYPGDVVRYVHSQASFETTRTGERGTVTVGPTASYTPGAWPGATLATALYSCAPDEYYEGSAYIEDTALGYTHIGRTDVEPFYARVGNGLVRAKFSTTAQLTFQWWNGSAWTGGVALNFSLGYGSGGVTTTLTTASSMIIKNAPDECIVRYLMWNQGLRSMGNEWVATIDLACRRGDRCVRALMNSSGGFGCQMAFASATACTSKSYGLRSTATTSSEYIVLATDYATTKDTVNGSLSAGLNYPPVVYGIGVSSGGGTGTGTDDADGIGRQMMAVYGSTQKVVVN